MLQTDDGERTITLREPGAYTILPRATRHTAKTLVRTRVLFVTPGEGTRHRDG